jgi:hypothetical protein
VVECGGRLVVGGALGCPRPLMMLSVLQLLAANAHDFARVFGDVMVVFGSEASRTCRRFRWMSSRRGCSNLQMLLRTRRRSVESLGEIVVDVRLLMFISRCKSWIAEGTYRWYA